MRSVVHEFPSLEAVEAWVEDIKANREQLHTLGAKETPRGFVGAISFQFVGSSAQADCGGYC